MCKENKKENSIELSTSCSIDKCYPPMPRVKVLAEKKIIIEKLRIFINKNSLENWSDTPDFILAEYLFNCFENFNLTVNTARSK